MAPYIIHKFSPVFLFVPFYYCEQKYLWLLIKAINVHQRFFPFPLVSKYIYSVKTVISRPGAIFSPSIVVSGHNYCSV